MSRVSTDLRRGRRELSIDAIVAAAVDGLREGAPVTMRAVAARMGVTAPALYRHVADRDALVELVIAELWRAATADCATSLADLPFNDPAARLVVASAALWGWAADNPKQFAMLIAHPLPSSDAAAGSRAGDWDISAYFIASILQIFAQSRFPRPELEDLESTVQELVLDERVFPCEAAGLARVDRGVLWVCLRAWYAVLSTVALEAGRHGDPSLIEAGSLFRAVVIEWLERFGLGEDLGRIVDLLDRAIAARLGLQCAVRQRPPGGMR